MSEKKVKSVRIFIFVDHGCQVSKIHIKRFNFKRFQLTSVTDPHPSHNGNTIKLGTKNTMRNFCNNLAPGANT
jgi:hypothetical protein